MTGFWAKPWTLNQIEYFQMILAYLPSTLTRLIHSETLTMTQGPAYRIALATSQINLLVLRLFDRCVRVELKDLALILLKVCQWNYQDLIIQLEEQDVQTRVFLEMTFLVEFNT